MKRNVDIKRVQGRLLEMALTIRDILERNDIPYFITYGTLLGAVRHRGFIPWDDDFDFYLFDDSYEKALDILRSSIPASMMVEDSLTEPRFFHGWSRIKDKTTITENVLSPQDNVYTCKGLNVDLYRVYKSKVADVPHARYKFLCDYLNRRHSVGLLTSVEFEQRLKKAKEYYQKWQNETDSTNQRVVYVKPGDVGCLEIDELFPLRKYDFEGNLFYGPNDSHSLLSRFYGNYMQLPPEDKRHPHYSSVRFVD